MFAGDQSAIESRGAESAGVGACKKAGKKGREDEDESEVVVLFFVLGSMPYEGHLQPSSLRRECSARIDASSVFSELSPSSLAPITDL